MSTRRPSPRVLVLAVVAVAAACGGGAPPPPPGIAFFSDRAEGLASPLGEEERPAYDALAEDGVLEVAAAFGQMREGTLAADDHGLWSAARFLLALEQMGFRRDPDGPPWQDGHRYTRRLGALLVRVDVAGPDVFRLEDQEGASELLRGLVAGYDLLYLNGHAYQESLDVLGDPAARDPRHAYRLLVLDLCWSYQLYAAPALAAAPGGSLHVVGSAARVTTGSVESFLALLEHVLYGARAAADPGLPPAASWYEILFEMNELAAARLEERAANGFAEGNFALPEHYGVSGLGPATP